MTTATKGNSNSGAGATAGGTYGLGFIGSLVYFLQSADGFWDGVWGVVQAVFWPAFLVYDLFSFLGT